MRCVIILHNMFVKGLKAFNTTLNADEGTTGIVVGGGVPEVWCDLMGMHAPMTCSTYLVIFNSQHFTVSSLLYPWHFLHDLLALQKAIGPSDVFA